jgi:hypothetical protein
LVFGQHRQEEEIVERIVEETIFPFCFFCPEVNAVFLMSWGCVKLSTSAICFRPKAIFDGLYEPGSRPARETNIFPNGTVRFRFRQPTSNAQQRVWAANRKSAQLPT